jgi:hypothetical protein
MRININITDNLTPPHVDFLSCFIRAYYKRTVFVKKIPHGLATISTAALLYRLSICSPEIPIIFGQPPIQHSKDRQNILQLPHSCFAALTSY